MPYLLDSSALLAVIKQEPGAENVLPYLSDAVMLQINVAETVTKLVEDGYDAELAFAQIQRFELDVREFDDATITELARLKLIAKKMGYSLGDRSCLAYAKIYNLSVLTADKRWSDMDIGIDIHQIR